MNLRHACLIARVKISLAWGIHYCPKFISFGRQVSLYCKEHVYIYIYIYIYTYIHTQTHICVEIVYELLLLPNNTGNETLLHNSGAVRNVDWIFLVELPADWANTWYWIKHCTIQSSLQTSNSSIHSYFHSFLLVVFLEETCFINICMNCIIVIHINNNAIINNNLWKIPRPYFALQNSHGIAIEFLRLV